MTNATTTADQQRDASKNLNLNARCGGHDIVAAACDGPTDAYVTEHRNDNDTAHPERSNAVQCVVENSLNDELTPHRISSDCYSSTTSTTPLPRTLIAFQKSHEPSSTLSSSLPDRNTDCSEEDSIRIHPTEKNVDPTQDRHSRRVIDSAAVEPLSTLCSSLRTAAIAATSPAPPDPIYGSSRAELDDCRLERETNFECNSERSSLNLPLILIEFVSTLNSSSLAHDEPCGTGSEMGNTQPKSKSQHASANASHDYDPSKNAVKNMKTSSRLSPTLNENNKDIFYEASSELSVDDDGDHDRSPMTEIDARPTNGDSRWADSTGVVDAQNCDYDFINKIANNTCESASSCVGRDGGASSGAATATPIMLGIEATYSCDGRSERDNSVFAATNNSESMEKNRVYRVYESAGDGDIDFSDLDEIPCTKALVTEVHDDDDDDGLHINRGRRASDSDDPIAMWHRRHGHQDAVQIVEVTEGEFDSDESIDDGGKVEEIPDIHVIKIMVEGVEVLNNDLTSTAGFDRGQNVENIEIIEEIEEIIEVTDDEEDDEDEEISIEATASGDSSASAAPTHENENHSAFTKFINQQPSNGNTINNSSKYNHLNNSNSNSVNSHRSHNSHTSNNSNSSNSNNSKNDVENVILFNDQPHIFSNSGINGTDTVGAVAPPSLYITNNSNRNNNSNLSNNNNQNSFNGSGGGGANNKKSVRFTHMNSDDSDNNFPNKIMKMGSVHRKDDKYQQYHANGKYGGDEPMQLPDIVVESVESTIAVNGIDDSEQSQSTEASSQSQSTGDEDASCSAEETDADSSEGEQDEEDISASASVEAESEPSENET